MGVLLLSFDAPLSLVLQEKMTRESLSPFHDTHCLIDIYHTPLFPAHIFLNFSNSFDGAVGSLHKNSHGNSYPVIFSVLVIFFPC